MIKNKMTQLLLAVAFVSGCGNSAPEIESPSDEQILRAIEDFNRKAAATTPPKPKVVLPDLDGWSRSEPKSLPPDDHGFTVAYDHQTGVTVTLYQFTRGLRDIPNDLASEPVQKEMQRAKSGIEQAVKLGLWNAAKETDSGTISLGDSNKKALWSRYTLTVNGGTAISDIYIWSHANTLFKLRCSGRNLHMKADTTVITELLTALGNVCSSDSK